MKEGQDVTAFVRQYVVSNDLQRLEQLARPILCLHSAVLVTPLDQSD